MGCYTEFELEAPLKEALPKKVWKILTAITGGYIEEWYSDEYHKSLIPSEDNIDYEDTWNYMVEEAEFWQGYVNKEGDTTYSYVIKMKGSYKGDTNAIKAFLSYLDHYVVLPKDEVYGYYQWETEPQEMIKKGSMYYV